MLTHEINLETAVSENDRISVEYAVEAMQELRRLAVDGFNAFAHGGREIGGVLYGRREAAWVHVLACVELECEHALGPRFLLSEKDHASMAELMQPREGLEAVGWYRAHTRGGLDLDANDREIFDRYFEQPLSVSLILKPTHWGPASGAFYVRNPAGAVEPEAAREFAIEPLKPETAEEAPAAEEASPAGVLFPADADVIEEIAVPERALVEAPRLVPMRASEAPPRQRPSWPWAMCAGALLGAIVTFGYISRPAGKVRTDEPHPAQAQPRAAAGVPERTAFVNTAAPAVATLEMPQPPASTVGGEDRREILPEPKAPAARRPVAMRIPDGIAPSAVREPKASIGPAAMPAPPVADLNLAHSPNLPLPALVFNPVLSAGAPAPPPVTAVTRVLPYAGPREGRLIWTGVLERHGVIEMDGVHASIGSVTGVLPGVPSLLRVLPAEFSRDGLTVFTPDRARDGKSEPPAKSNGWNGVHFKFDEGRAHELVLLETPNVSNSFQRLVVRNDGRRCPVVMMDWTVQ